MSFNNNNIEKLFEILKKLGNPNVLKIFFIIDQKPGISIKEFDEYVDLSASKISYHVKDLVLFGLVKKTRKQNTVRLELTECGKQLAEIINKLLKRRKR